MCYYVIEIENRSLKIEYRGHRKVGIEMKSLSFKEDITIIDAKDRQNQPGRKYDIDENIVTIYNVTLLNDTTKAYISTRISLDNYVDKETGVINDDGRFELAGALLINPIRSEKPNGLKYQTFEEIDPQKVWYPEPKKPGVAKSPRDKAITALINAGIDKETAEYIVDNPTTVKEKIS